ncbi:MAG TPA: DUF167 domain-containing protein [Acidimicrobiia bacterium]|jgi:uncharacterized protein (TIGR00251 family)
MAGVTDLYDVVDDAVVLHVHVQPGAGRSAIVGRHGDALKVRVAAPPVDNRANDAAGAILAETFGVKRGAVELIAGQKSRIKRFRIRGLDLDEIEGQVHQILADAEERVGEPRRKPR